MQDLPTQSNLPAHINQRDCHKILTNGGAFFILQTLIMDRVAPDKFGPDLFLFNYIKFSIYYPLTNVNSIEKLN